MLGTEMALLYLEKPIENSGVASIDSLFGIPDFRANERIMSILIKIRAITQKAFVVQTRSRNEKIFDYATKGNLMDFFRDEVEERKKLSYPPFTTLIKLTARGTKDQVDESMKLVEKELEKYDPIVFPAFVEVVAGKSVMHALIKIERSEGISKNLLDTLLKLPPQIAVNVDPESLL